MVISNFNKYKKIITINITIFSIMLITIEGLFQLIDYSKKLVFKKNESILNSKEKIIPTTWQNEFHPGVGHSHSIKDFRVNANASGLEFNKLSLKNTYGEHPNKKYFLVLGGSTSDPLGTQLSGYRGTWDIQLFEKMAKVTGIQFNVINAAMGGSTSSNELKRLITFIHDSQLDYAISLNGINEIYFSENKEMQDFTNVLSSRMVIRGINQGIIKGNGGDTFLKINNPLKSIKGIILPNLKTYQALSKLKKTIKNDQNILNIETKKSLEYAANRWLINTRLMASAAKEFDIEYYTFLQPTFGLDNTSIAETDDLNNKFPKLSNLYLKKINYLYSYLRKFCDKLTYCFDISNYKFLNQNSDLYTDPRHLNFQGNKYMAEIMMEMLYPKVKKKK